MAQYAGLSKQEAIRRIQSDAESRAYEIIKTYNDGLDTLTKLAEVDYMSWTGIRNLAIGSLHHLFKGYMDGYVNVLAALSYLFIGVANDIGRMFDPTDGRNAGEDFNYLLKNAAYTAGEGINAVATSMIANLSRLGAQWGLTPDITQQTFGAGGYIEVAAESFAAARARNLMKDDGADRTYEQNKKVVDDNYYGWAKSLIYGDTREQRNHLQQPPSARLPGQDHPAAITGGILGMQEYATGKITPYIANIGPLDVGKKADDYFGNDELYNAISGSMDSIGTILGSWGVAKIGKKKLNIGNKGAAMVGQAYFAASVFGRSMQEAVGSGADLQDAYTYALGHSMMETALENIGGFVPYGERLGITKIFQNSPTLLKGFAKISSRFLSEAFEEAAAEYGQTGLEYYVKENGIEILPDEDFYRQVMFAAIAGGMSSLILGGFADINLHYTVDAKAIRVMERLDQQLHGTQEQQIRSLEKVRADLSPVVDTLNKETVRGYKYNKRGGAYVGKLTHAERVAWVKRMKMDNAILAKDDGTFQLDLDRVTPDMFRNRIDGKAIEKGEYAVTRQTRATELTDATFVNGKKIKPGKKTPIKIDDATELGKKALQEADSLGVDAVLYTDSAKDAATGSYNPSSGVIFLNQDKLTDQNYRRVIKSHELMHKIQYQQPELYNKILKMISDHVDYDKTDGKLVVKNQALADALGPSFIKNIEGQMRDIIKAGTQAGMTPLAMVDMMMGEVAAHFVENIVAGNETIGYVMRQKPSIGKGIAEMISEDAVYKRFAKEDKVLRKQLKRISDTFASAAAENVRINKTVHAMAVRVWGSMARPMQMFKAEITQKYDDDTLMQAFGKMDFAMQTITIAGEVFDFNDVFEIDVTKINPKRMEVPDADDIRDSFVFDEGETSLYIRILKQFQDEWEQQEDGYNLPLEERVFIKRQLDVAEHLFEDIRKKRFPIGDTVYQDLKSDGMHEVTITVAEKLDLLIDLYTTYQILEAENKDRKKRTVDVDTLEYVATKNTLQNAIKHLKEYSAFHDFKNRSRATSIESSAQMIFEIQDQQNAQAEVDSIATAIAYVLASDIRNKANKIKSFKDVFDIRANVRHEIKKIVTNKTDDIEITQGELVRLYGEVLLVPRQEYIDKEVEKLRERREQRVEKNNRLFPDSKIANKSGELLKVYHGTTKKFEKFDNVKLGSTTASVDSKLGFHFSENKGVQKIFGNNFKYFHLDMRKPFDMRVFPSNEILVDFDAIMREVSKDHYEKEYDSSAEALFKEVFQTNKLGEFKDNIVQTPGLLEAIKQRGYDGFVFPLSSTEVIALSQIGEDVKGHEFIVFDTDQIHIEFDQSETFAQNAMEQFDDIVSKVLDKAGIPYATAATQQNVFPVDNYTTVAHIEDANISPDAIVGMPGFVSLPLDKMINKAFEKTGIVAFALPMQWHASYALQKQVRNDVKLIHSEPMGILNVPIRKTATMQAKVVAQVWVLKSDKRFDSFPDIRQKDFRQGKHPDFQTVVLNGTQERYQAAFGFDFDIAIPTRGKIGTYNNFVTSYDGLKPNKNYLLIKAKNANILEKLKMIDYDILAEKGASMQIGFAAADLVEVYKTLDADLDINRKENITPLTPEEVRSIQNLFVDPTIAGNFVRNKKGVLVAKSNLLGNTHIASPGFLINGTFYSSSEYAVYSYWDTSAEGFNNSTYGFVEPMRIDELSLDQKTMFEILSTTKSSFVMYNPNILNILGYSKGEKNINTVFLNMRAMEYYKEYFFELLIHEMMHEAFKNLQLDTIATGKMYAELFFTNGSPNDLYTKFNETHIDTNFVQYMRDVYASKYGVKALIKNESDIHKILVTTQTNESALRLQNEIIAQITGYLFSHRDVFEKIFSGVDNQNLMPFQNLFDIVQTSVKYDSGMKAIFGKTLDTYSRTMNKYFGLLSQKFKVPKQYTRAQLNDFIKEFSEGRYTTKQNLLIAVLAEKSKNKRGDAIRTLDGIIFLAKQLGGIIQSGINQYTKLHQEMTALIDSANYLLTNPRQVGILRAKDLVPLYRKINKYIKEDIKKHRDPNDIFVITPEWLAKVEDNIVDFLIAYDEISLELREIFDFPDVKIIEDSIGDVRDALKMLFDAIDTNQKEAQVLLHVALLESSANVFADILEDSFSKANLEKGLLGSVARFVAAYQENTNKNIVYALKGKVQDFRRKLTLHSQQGKTALREELRSAIAYAEAFTEAFQKRGLQEKLLKTEVLDIMDDLYGLFRTHVDDEMAAYVWHQPGPDPNAQKIENLSGIAGEIEVNFQEMYRRLAGFFDDASIITSRYGNLKLTMPTKPLNEKALAANMVKVLTFFETKYKTGLGDGTQTHGEYALHIQKQIETMRKNNQEISTDKLDHFAGILPPQEFFRIYIEAAESVGAEIDFFKDFWDEYQKAATLQEEHMHRFDLVYRDFDKYNAHLKSRSLKMATIDSDFLLLIPPQVLSEIKEYHDKASRDHTESRRLLRSERRGYEQQISAYRKQMKDIKAQQSKKLKKTPDWVRLQDMYNDLAKEKEALRKKANFIRDEIQAQDAAYGVLTVDQRVKQDLVQYAKKNPEQQQVSRGHIISLYMSVLREIEMHESNNADLYPTNHFFGGNMVYIFDNQRLFKYGYANAKKHAEPFTIIQETREELRDYLETLLDAEDYDTIVFAKMMFDMNYDFVNKMYKDRFQVDLARQETYIPFASMESDYSREYDQDLLNRQNMGAYDGMTMKTRMGAAIPLRMENIFNAIENAVDRSARYAWDRVIKDFQNLLVVRPGMRTNFQGSIKDKFSVFGVDNHIEPFINDAFRSVLRFSDLSEDAVSRWIKRRLQDTVAATMAINFPSTMKQFASITTIALRADDYNFFQVVPRQMFNTFTALFPSKYRRWLNHNNKNFYFRARTGNNPNLTLQYNITTFYRLRTKFQRAMRVLGYPVGWSDNSVLVGAFATYVQLIEKANPNKTEAEIFEMANKKLNYALLYGVANTNPAYRARFSSSPNVMTRMFSKFQSENVMQWAGIIRAYYLAKNKHRSAQRMLGRNIFAHLLSSLFSAWMSFIARETRGQLDDVNNKHFEFWVNEFMWQNMIGSIPYFNQVMNAVQITDKGITEGFGFNVPGIYELERIFNSLAQISQGRNIGRNVLRVAEQVGQMYAVPVRNANRIWSTTAKLFGEQTGSSSALAMSAWYRNKTRSQMMMDAARSGNEKVVQHYVGEMYSALAVQNELVRLLTVVEGGSLSIYDVDQFRSMNEIYKIPQRTKDKYKSMSQKTLARMIRSTEYRRLPNSEKLKAVQRVINYYYNYMKDDITGKRSIRDIIADDRVVETALKTAKTAQQLRLEARSNRLQA